MSALDIVLRRQNDMAKCLNCEQWVTADPERIKGRCIKHDMITLDLHMCSAWERAKNPAIEVKTEARSA